MTAEEFAQIVAETKGVVLKAIAEHLPRKYYEAIDDIAQETWLRAYKALTQNTFEGRSKVSTWLYTIARNETCRYLKKVEREDGKRQKFSAQRTVPSRLSQKDTVNSESNIINALPKNFFEKGLFLLNARQQAIVRLKLSGCSDQQTAMLLKLSPGTVKSAFSRAREKLARFYFQQQEKNPAISEVISYEPKNNTDW